MTGIGVFIGPLVSVAQRLAPALYYGFEKYQFKNKLKKLIEEGAYSAEKEDLFQNTFYQSADQEIAKNAWSYMNHRGCKLINKALNEDTQTHKKYEHLNDGLSILRDAIDLSDFSPENIRDSLLDNINYHIDLANAALNSMDQDLTDNTSNHLNLICDISNQPYNLQDTSDIESCSTLEVGYDGDITGESKYPDSEISFVG